MTFLVGDNVKCNCGGSESRGCYVNGLITKIIRGEGDESTNLLVINDQESIWATHAELLEPEQEPCEIPL